ncbi:hypothetical protein [Sinorhizobium meliloti]|nr:hypothetical protein [Sinorhizobium meliloti]
MKVSGRYWHQRRQETTAREVSDPKFHDQLMAELAELSGITIF